jgi:hypothetical protein
VDEHLKHNARVDLVCFHQGDVELGEGVFIVVLCVDDEHERTTAREDGLRVESRVEKVQLARKIPDLKLNERTT